MAKKKKKGLQSIIKQSEREHKLLIKKEKTFRKNNIKKGIYELGKKPTTIGSMEKNLPILTDEFYRQQYKYGTTFKQFVKHYWS